MTWSDSYYDPPYDDCEKCMEAGLDDCQCEYVDGYDPLDDPNFSLTDDHDGMTIEEVREVEWMVRNSCSLCGDLCEVKGNSIYCSNCDDEMEREVNA